jgi:hypothetical protein
MKTKIKVILIVVIFSSLSYSSCDVFEAMYNCKKCSKPGEKTVEACGQHEIDDYEERNYDCK